MQRVYKENEWGKVSKRIVTMPTRPYKMNQHQPCCSHLSLPILTVSHTPHLHNHLSLTTLHTPLLSNGSLVLLMMHHLTHRWVLSGDMGSRKATRLATLKVQLWLMGQMLARF